MIEAPAAFGAKQRSERRHIGAIQNGGDLQRSHQFVRIAHHHGVSHVLANLGKARLSDFHLRRDLRWLEVVVHEAPGLVFKLVRRNSVLPPCWRQHARLLAGDVTGVVVGKVDIRGEFRRVLPRHRAVGERAQHVIVRYACHVARGIEARYRGACELVDIDAGCAVAGAEPDLGNMHLDHPLAVVRAAIFVEPAARRPLDVVQHGLDLADGVAMQMVELQEHRPLAGLQFVIKLLHHLARPIVALDEAIALAVGGIGAERTGHIGAGGTVVILDQRIDLIALEIREPRSGMIGHRISVAGIGGILVGAPEISGLGQAETSRRAGAKDHGFGPQH